MKKAIIFIAVALGGLILGTLIFSSHSTVNTIREVVNNGIGAGAHSKSTKQVACASITSLTTSTAIQNTDSGSRIVDKAVFYADGVNVMNAATTIVGFNTSTDGVASGT